MSDAVPGERWPDGRRAAISITVDNLGEASEIALGMRSPDEPRGDHYSVTTGLPMMLDELDQAKLPATFFVEGINAETYPAAVAEIADAGHEVAYHAWCHEQWGDLDDDEAEAENLDRGIEAMRAVGVTLAGFRPPGGELRRHTLRLLAERGFRYCSPSAEAATGQDAVAVLPFRWPAVDAFHVLPSFAALRARLTTSEEAGGVDGVHAALSAEVDRLLEHGGHTCLVLHNWLVEAERDAVRDILARVAAATDRGDLWVARCDQVAERFA